MIGGDNAEFVWLEGAAKRHRLHCTLLMLHVNTNGRLNESNKVNIRGECLGLFCCQVCVMVLHNKLHSPPSDTILSMCLYFQVDNHIKRTIRICFSSFGGICTYMVFCIIHYVISAEQRTGTAYGVNIRCLSSVPKVKQYSRFALYAGGTPEPSGLSIILFFIARNFRTYDQSSTLDGH